MSRATYFRESRPHSAVEVARELEVCTLLGEILIRVVSDDVGADPGTLEAVGGTDRAAQDRGSKNRPTGGLPGIRCATPVPYPQAQIQKATYSLRWRMDRPVRCPGRPHCAGAPQARAEGIAEAPCPYLRCRADSCWASFCSSGSCQRVWKLERRTPIQPH